LERDGLVEFEYRATVECGERLPIKLECQVITVPAGFPWTSRPASPYRATFTTFEFMKIAA
jgi:hypothetical protein